MGSRTGEWQKYMHLRQKQLEMGKCKVWSGAVVIASMKLQTCSSCRTYSHFGERRNQAGGREDGLIAKVDAETLVEEEEKMQAVHGEDTPPHLGAGHLGTGQATM